MSVLPDADVISLARGIPSPEMFPQRALAESARAAIEEDGAVALNYGPPYGYGPLREWLAARHGTAPERILVTPGSLIGLNLVVWHLFADGGRAVVEAPTYDRMLHSLRGLTSDVLSVARTADGIDLDRLRDICRGDPKPSLLYVLPTFHNPTGRTLTLEERSGLVELALEHELLVFEDDPYGLLRVDGEPEPYLYELLRERGGDELALFSSSFSKIAAPGLRVGYLVLPESLYPPLEALAMKTYVSPPILAQAQLFHFLRAGYLEPHLEFLRKFLRPRRDALLAVLEEGLAGTAEWTRPDGGYFLWLELPEPLDAEELNARARGVGVAFVPGAGFFAGGGGRGTARLSFSYPSPSEIREAATRLVALVQAAL